MADQAVQTKLNEAKADTLRIADAVSAPAVQTAKTEAVKTAESKPETPVAVDPKVVAKVATPAKKPVAARKPKARTKAQPAKSAAKVVKITKPAAKSAKPAVKAIKTGVKIMTTQTNKTAAAGFAAAEQIKTVVTEANDRAKTAMEKNAKIIEELAELGRGNVEALVASSKVAAKGAETLSQDAANYSRARFEEATAAFKSFTDVKSATDFFKLQGDFARTAFDSAVAESARVSEAMLKLAGDVAEPLTSRYAVAADRVKTLAA